MCVNIKTETFRRGVRRLFYVFNNYESFHNVYDIIIICGTSMELIENWYFTFVKGYPRYGYSSIRDVRSTLNSTLPLAYLEEVLEAFSTLCSRVSAPDLSRWVNHVSFYSVPIMSICRRILRNVHIRELSWYYLIVE